MREGDVDGWTAGAVHAVLGWLAGISAASLWTLTLLPEAIGRAASRMASVLGPLDNTYPLAAVAAILLWLFGLGTLTHFLLVAMGDGRRLRGPGATLAVLGHSVGKGAPLLAIPIAGVPLALAWTYVAAVLGLRTLMGVRTWKGAIACLIPTAVLAGGFLAGFADAFREIGGG